MNVGSITFGPPTRHWDSIARRYVEHDTLPQETFGPMRAVANARAEADASMGTFKEALRLREERKLKEPVANDKEPLYRNTESRDGFTEDGIVPVAIYGMPSEGGKVFLKPRRGDFMQTYTARQFWPLDARPDEVHIEDIAHSLSLQCRYAGHCQKFYSVAEHSVMIANWIWWHGSAADAFCGLMHDATEAYLVDMPRPVKRSMHEYRLHEAALWKIIASRYGLPEVMPDVVHEADNRIIADELVNMRPMAWHTKHDDPLGVELQFWTPEQAEAAFLETFARLTEMRVAA